MITCCCCPSPRPSPHRRSAMGRGRSSINSALTIPGFDCSLGDGALESLRLKGVPVPPSFLERRRSMWTTVRSALGGAALAAILAVWTLSAHAQSVAAVKEPAPAVAEDAGKLATDIHEEIATVQVSLRLPDGR